MSSYPMKKKIYNNYRNINRTKLCSCGHRAISKTRPIHGRIVHYVRCTNCENSTCFRETKEEALMVWNEVVMR